MTAQTIVREIDALPPAMQREVVDFIVFLRQRRGKATGVQRPLKRPLSRDPFIGIWARRGNMADSGKWVRDVRRSEWAR